MVGRHRRKVEQRIVIARILPIEESCLGRIDNICDDEVIVTAAELSGRRPGIDPAQARFDRLSIAMFDAASIASGGSRGVERASGQRQRMQLAQCACQLPQLVVVRKTID